MINQSDQRALCTFCHRPYHPIEVHGHVQCSVCKTNIDPCCGGAEFTSQASTTRTTTSKEDEPPKAG